MKMPPVQLDTSAGVQQKLPRLTWGRGGRTACRLELLAYEPSEWEEEWREHAEEYQDRTCKVMLEQSDLVDAWMQPMNISFSPKVVAMAMPAMQSSRVRALACTHGWHSPLGATLTGAGVACASYGCHHLTCMVRLIHSVDIPARRCSRISSTLTAAAAGRCGVPSFQHLPALPPACRRHAGC